MRCFAFNRIVFKGLKLQMKRIIDSLKKHWKKTLLSILIALVLVVIIPVIINECYKADTVVYVTMWEAADVLNFYGTLLAAIVSVGILAATILYNRKQIISERTFQIEQEKWFGIENIVEQVLDEIHPATIQKALADAAEKQRIDLFYIKLNLYQTTATAAVDKLLFLNTKSDMPDFLELANNINSYMQKVSQIVKRYNSLFFDVLQKNFILKSAQEGNAIPDYMLAFAAKVTSDFVKQSNEISKQLSEIYEDSYRPLIRLKRNVFDKINQRLLTNT